MEGLFLAFSGNGYCGIRVHCGRKFTHIEETPLALRSKRLEPLGTIGTNKLSSDFTCAGIALAATFGKVN
jgi:hypothetical protein